MGSTKNSRAKGENDETFDFGRNHGRFNEPGTVAGILLGSPGSGVETRPALSRHSGGEVMQDYVTLLETLLERAKQEQSEMQAQDRRIGNSYFDGKAEGLSLALDKARMITRTTGGTV
jgi:hypothetical protein